MPTTKTYDAEDNLVSYVEDPLRVTISWEDSRTEYGAGVKAGVHMQVPLRPEASPLDVASATNEAFNTAKVLVDGALKDAAQPTAKEVTPRPKAQAAAPRSGGTAQPSAASRAQRSPGAPTDEQKAAAWLDLQANPDGWFDNRNDKRSPKAPDFKGKRTNPNFAEFALWMDSAPADFEVF